MKREFGFYVLIVLGVLLTALLVMGQTSSLFNYEAAVSLGLQESVEEIGEVGIAWAKGFAFGDSLIYIPLLVFGIVGLWYGRRWGSYCMFAALAITAYWPIVNLYAVFVGADLFALSSSKYVVYSIVLPFVSVYGFWGMWYLYGMGRK